MKRVLLSNKNLRLAAAAAAAVSSSKHWGVSALRLTRFGGAEKEADAGALLGQFEVFKLAVELGKQGQCRCSPHTVPFTYVDYKKIEGSKGECLRMALQRLLDVSWKESKEAPLAVKKLDQCLRCFKGAEDRVEIDDSFSEEY